MEQPLGSLGSGTMTAAAYDSAFAARVRQVKAPDDLAYPKPLRWLLQHQDPGASFGTRLPAITSLDGRVGGGSQRKTGAWSWPAAPGRPRSAR